MNIEKKKNPNKITIILTNRELEILNIMWREEGQHSISDLVHDCINYYYNKKYYSKYKSVSLQPKIILTDEQKCEAMNGRVENKEGIMKCIFKYAAGERTFPLEKSELYYKK